MEWQDDMSKAPKHTDVLVYRDDAGVMLAQLTHMADWLIDENDDWEKLGISEEDAWEEVWWSYFERGVSRMSDDGGDPTHWMPLPTPPESGHE